MIIVRDADGSLKQAEAEQVIDRHFNQIKPINNAEINSLITFGPKQKKPSNKPKYGLKKPSWWE